MLLPVFNLIIPALLLTLILGQAVYVGLYLRMRRRSRDWVENSSLDKPVYTPRAAVILCLRGRDPTLTRCLKAIARLEYPDFELHTVFDSELDPAFETAQAFQAQTKIKVHTHVIPSFSRQCGMKCEALITAIRALDATVEVIAVVDADSIVAPTWLREIVHPLQDPRVGASTGDRWFEPQADFASISRAVWNAAAIVQMNLYRIAWGGSLAMRMETVERLKILDVWSKTFCEDTVLVDLFQKSNLVVQRPRNVVVFNNEQIAWKNLHFWIARQLLTVRLHNRKWPLVFGHGLLVGLTLILCGTLLFVNALQWNGWGVAQVALVVLVSELINFLLIGLIANENVERLRALGQLSGKSSLAQQPWRWILAIPLTQIMHFLSTIRAVTMRHVIWRGIEYHVTRERVELINYRPFVDRKQPQVDESSLN